MRGIVADANIEGHVERLVGHILTGDWVEFWNHLGLELEVFGNIGLQDRSPDDAVWRTCQRERLVLITANRNGDGPLSLDAVIRSEGGADSLPVMTVGTPRRLLADAVYREQATAKLIDYLLSIDNYRGTGRLYIP